MPQLAHAPEKHTVDDKDSLNDAVHAYVDLMIEIMQVSDKQLDMICTKQQ